MKKAIYKLLGLIPIKGEKIDLTYKRETEMHVENSIQVKEFEWYRQLNVCSQVPKHISH